jgi:hypothetical protein
VYHQVHERVCREMITVTVMMTLVSTVVPTLHSPYPLPSTTTPPPHPPPHHHTTTPATTTDQRTHQHPHDSVTARTTADADTGASTLAERSCACQHIPHGSVTVRTTRQHEATQGSRCGPRLHLYRQVVSPDTISPDTALKPPTAPVPPDCIPRHCTKPPDWTSVPPHPQTRFSGAPQTTRCRPPDDTPPYPLTRFSGGNPIAQQPLQPLLSTRPKPYDARRNHVTPYDPRRICFVLHQLSDIPPR